MEKIPCSCGCGQLISKYNKWYHRRYFIKGHSTRINIPINLLKKLYIAGKKTPKQIGEKLNCGPNVIRRTLKENNIHLRTNSEAHKGKEWAENRLAPIDLSMTENMAYTLGVIFGDGSVFKTNQGHYLIKLHVTSIDFVKSFKNALHIIGLNPSKIKRRINGGNQSDSFEIYTFSKRFYKYFKNINIESLGDELIKKRSLIFAWLKGFYESEGCITRNKNKALIITITNTNLKIVDLVQKLLDIIDIKYSCYLTKRNNPNHKPKYSIYIRGKSIEKQKFIEELNPTIKRYPL